MSGSARFQIFYQHTFSLTSLFLQPLSDSAYQKISTSLSPISLFLILLIFSLHLWLSKQPWKMKINILIKVMIIPISQVLENIRWAHWLEIPLQIVKCYTHLSIIVWIVAIVIIFLAPDKSHQGYKPVWSCLANCWNRWSEVYLHQRLRCSWELLHFEDRRKHCEFDTVTKLLKMIN